MSEKPFPPILEVRHVGKRFPSVQALEEVSLELWPGEVLAVIGENGAGKSTLMKILAGVQTLTTGEILVDGQPVTFANVEQSLQAGVSLIHQELNLASNLNVGANIFLGREAEKSYFGGLIHTLDDTFMLRESEEALSSLDVEIPEPKEPIETLSGGQRQAVAIARAVYWDAKLMIMDEPTNNLGVPEQHKVLELINKLRERGVPVILISHTLPEVFSVADRLIVMHRGRKVTEKKIDETNSEEVVQYMVGALDDTKEVRQRA